MKTHPPTTFILRSMALGLFLLAAGAGAMPIPDDCKIGEFALGCQSYSFNGDNVFDAIDKTAATGSKIIELYPGQKYSADQPGVKFDHNATDEMIAAVKARLEKDGIRAVNYGVVNIPKDEAGARKIFEFAKKFNLYGITTESDQSIDTIEKLVKEYDICVGFHNHAHNLKNPSYRMWDPNYILSVVKDRDPRIGACADIGHWFHSNLDPVDCAKILQGRIISVHLKDANREVGPDGSVTHFEIVPFGKGMINLSGFLAELKRQNFKGNLSIEYEAKFSHNVPEITQCIEYMRARGMKQGGKL